jgi:hypothetical protein
MCVRSLYFRKYVKHGFMATLALIALPATANEQPAHDTEIVEAPPLRGDDALRSVMLLAHNNDRSVMMLPPLIWDEVLAQDARKWAQSLAQRGVFEHAPRTIGASAQGENLWMGTREAYAFEAMTQMWLDERQSTRSGIFPNVSTTGSWQDVAHFTQMLWPTTRSVGCALASNADDDFLVCRYFPAGNRIGDLFSMKPRK